jgi:hypothetical protein
MNAEFVQNEVAMHAIAIGGRLEAEVGEQLLLEMSGEAKSTLLGAKTEALQAINVDHHQRFGPVGSAFSLEVIGVGACHVISKALVGHLVEPSVVLAQDEEDCVIGVDGPRLKHEIAVGIDLVLYLLVIPARLLEGEVIRCDSLSKPGEILGVDAVHDGGVVQLLMVEASGGKGDVAMIFSRSARDIGREVFSHSRIFFEGRCRTGGLPS